MIEVDAKLDAWKLEEANADLSQIEIDFCGNPWEKTIEYVLAPGWKQEICLEANNMSDKDIEITIGFVDGTFTNDERKNKACMEQGEIQNFGQYVTGYTETFVVWANNISFQRATLQLPKSTTGTVNGCLVYYTKSVEMGGDVNFSVLMRKAKFINIQIRENIFVKKYLFRMLTALLVLYYAKTYISSHKKKPPKNR